MATLNASDDLVANLTNAYATKVGGAGQRMAEAVALHLDDYGQFKKAATSSRFVRGVVKSMASELLAPTADLIRTSAQYSMGSLASLPNADQIGRVSVLAMEKVAEANYMALAGEMGKVVKGFEATLKRDITALFTNPKPTSITMDLLASSSNKLQAQATTILNTSVASVQREIHATALDAMPGEPMAIYMGPSAGARPFCKVLDGRVIKRKQFSQLDNHQKGARDFGTFCGGWNCRHRLLPVSASYVKRHKLRPINKATISKANRAAGGA
tara:strand:- start:284 stop:1096 length:813 start_codon:yes stop_codon:yes gene_type:complete